jgi:2-deoxy-D-gluconate 3-dehydrogenase
MSIPPLSSLTNLTGKTAIVTGGAVGIGYGIAYRLAEAGANVVIADINKATLAEATRSLHKINPRVLPVVADVSKKTSVQALMAATVKKFKTVDILVNNAGIYPNILVMNMKEQEFDRILDINLKGIFHCTQAAAKQMIKQKKGGKIINITSIDALHPSMTGLATYDASKHGAWGFTKNVALELAPHNIWVNAIAPGGIATPGTGVGQKSKKPNAGADMSAAIKAFMARIPMGRMGDPDDIGKVALFLASDMSSYLTGTQIVVDGGYLLK